MIILSKCGLGLSSCKGDGIISDVNTLLNCLFMVSAFVFVSLTSYHFLLNEQHKNFLDVDF